MVTRVRSDALPEGFDYPDWGCSFHPSCLACPLPGCRYDPSYYGRQLLARLRASRLQQLRAEGFSVRKAAQALGISVRTAWRLRKIPVEALLAAPPTPEAP